jgi:outer membrane protein TolC
MQRGLLPAVLCVVLLGSLPLQTALGQSDETARLSLDECLHAALANNLDLVSAKKDPVIAEQQIDLSKAPFDPTISAGSNYSDYDSEDTNVITDDVGTVTTEPGGTTREALESDVSFSHLLDFGGLYSVTYNYTDSDISFTGIEPITGLLSVRTIEDEISGFTFGYEMPLLNGFGKEFNTVDILLARGGLEISKEDLRLKAMQTAKLVEDAYWDVLATREALRISRLALERAEDLLELNKKKVEVGTLAPIEITEAEAGVASQVELVIVAEADLEYAEDLLLQLMGVAEDDPMWEQALDLTDRPSFTPVKVDLEDAIATAFERRPEMTTARQALRDNELSERVAKRKVQHELDLTASVTPNRPTDTLQSTALAGIGVVSDVDIDTEETDWQVGLRYTYHLRNRASKANYAIAKLNTEKSDLALQDWEQQIRVDVRNSARNLESGLKRVEAASKNVELQQKKLEAEQKKFDNGMSTSFEVLTFQNDLADSELKEIRARLDYVKSLSALEQSKGTLLEARGLSLGD